MDNYQTSRHQGTRFMNTNKEIYFDYGIYIVELWLNEYLIGPYQVPREMHLEVMLLHIN